MHSDDQIADDIRDYLERHQNAADSARGVHAWWLSPQRRAVALERVEGVLEAMAKRGELRRERLSGGTIVYRKADRSPVRGRGANDSIAN